MNNCCCYIIGCVNLAEVLSGIIGAVLSGIIALIIMWMTNKANHKENEQNRLHTLELQVRDDIARRNI